jgi:hypothetical protein
MGLLALDGGAVYAAADCVGKALHQRSCDDYGTLWDVLLCMLHLSAYDLGTGWKVLLRMLGLRASAKHCSMVLP